MFRGGTKLYCNATFWDFCRTSRHSVLVTTFLTCVKIVTCQQMPWDIVPKSRPKVATCHDWTFFYWPNGRLGQRYKQNAINVSGNESKLENVYMSIKIVKTVFWTFVKFYILSINPSKWTFSTSATEKHGLMILERVKKEWFISRLVVVFILN